jgi:putative tryptophan/tyrosine transport system substrate-binding protein
VKRREFITLLGGMAASPLAARAQQPAMPVIGFLNSASADTYSFNAVAFREGLRESGFVEGRNVAIEYRWANGDYTRLPELALDLASRRVAAIAATGDVPSARAALAATASIPIVFTVGSDPVRYGLVQSLNRPGANATGITLFSSTLGAKRMEVLTEALPHVRLIGLMMNPDNVNAESDQTDAEEAANTLGRRTIRIDAKGPQDFERAFAAATEKRVDALLVASDPMFLSQRVAFVRVAARHALPVVFWERAFVQNGGLLSYGTRVTWMYQQAGAYVGRILKGGKPAELPVEQPTKFELVINLATAKALGLEIPPILLARADEVIE